MASRKQTLVDFLQSESVQLSLLVVVALVVAVLDFLDALRSLPWLVARLPDLILVLLGFYILVSARTARHTLSELQALRAELAPDLSALTNVVKSMRHDLAKMADPSHQLRVREFADVGEAYDYVSQLIRGATDKVEDITWGSYTSYRTQKEQTSYEGYVRAMEDVCRKGNVMYKEISSLSDLHYLRRAQNLCAYYSYHLAYHDLSSTNVPLISFLIVDSQEVVVGFYKVPGVVSALEGIVYLSIRNPLLLKFFKDYYEKIWSKAVKIKEAAAVNAPVIASIEQRLRSSTTGGGDGDVTA